MSLLQWRAGRAGLGVQPRMPETLSGSGSLLRHELQHGQQEICEASSLLLRPLILLHQNLQKTPRLQLGDVFQVTFFGEKFLGVFPCYNELARHLPQELYDQGDVVFISSVILPRMRLKQIVPCG